MSVVRRMFYGSFRSTIRRWDSFFGSIRGKVNIRSNQVKKSQIFNSKFILKLNISSINMPILYSFSLRIPKMLFVFTYGNQKCQKLHLKKVTSSPLPVFFYYGTAKYIGIALKFGMCVVCMQLYNIYSVLIEKCQKSVVARLQRAPFYVFWRLRNVFYFKRAHSRSLQTFGAF